MSNPRIAILQDALVVRGGSERYALWLAEAFPDAPIFTSVFLPENTHPGFKLKDVHTLPGAAWFKSEAQFKRFFPFWVYQFQNLNLNNFDLVISSSTYLAKYFRPGSNTHHISIIHAPFRLLWSPDSYSDQSLPVARPLVWLARMAARNLRGWDLKETSRIEKIYANSINMAAELNRVYGREAEVIYPPVDIGRHPLTIGGDYYVTLSRLVSYKRIDLAVEACSHLGRKLKVIGDGPESARLQGLAGGNIEFLGALPEDEVIQILSRARALIFPGEEDFGIAPLEAMACGVPVIAFGKGGALETVKEGIAGVFFKRQTVADLESAIMTFEGKTFDPQNIRNSVLQFDKERFFEKIRSAVEHVLTS